MTRSDYGSKRNTGTGEKRFNERRGGGGLFSQAAIRGHGVCQAGPAPQNTIRISGSDLLQRQT